MAAVFPEPMGRLNPANAEESIKKVEDYIHYMVERMEFANSNTTKFFSESGTSNAAVIKSLFTVATSVSELSAQMNGIVNNVQSLSTLVTELNNSVSTLTTEVEALKQRVTTLEGGTSA